MRIAALLGELRGLEERLATAYSEAADRHAAEHDVQHQARAFAKQCAAHAELLGDHDIAVMEVDGFPHPLSAVYRRDTLPHVEALLANDRLRPVFLFDAVRTRRVQTAEMTSVDPQLQTLRNLNTPEDYQAALAEAGYQPR